MIIKKLTILCLAVCTGILCYSQKADTITITAAQINTKMLQPGTHRYLVYFKKGKDSSRTNYQLWSRTIKFTSYNGKEVISITQEWEDNDSVFHTAKSIVNKDDFSTLYHEVWWKRSGTHIFDYVSKTAFSNGMPLKSKSDSVAKKRQLGFEVSLDQYFLTWHLDLETFPLLPYKEGRVFNINFYDPGFDPPSMQYYSVIGSGTLTGYNNHQIECWLLQHGKLPENLEVFWISKETQEVLKLEQEFDGKYRYKIKLGYSN